MTPEIVTENCVFLFVKEAEMCADTTDKVKPWGHREQYSKCNLPLLDCYAYFRAYYHLLPSAGLISYYNMPSNHPPPE